jgi:hypothetical protein
MVMSQPEVDPQQCEALFASLLQESEVVTPEAAVAAIGRTLAEFGPAGCACKVAQEFGDHPEAAHHRMLWAYHLVADLDSRSPRRSRRTAA